MVQLTLCDKLTLSVSRPARKLLGYVRQAGPLGERPCLDANENDGRGRSARGGRDAPLYWMALPPDGDALSLPLAPIDEVNCQMVPVVLVKKYRVPVDVESGSAQAW